MAERTTDLFFQVGTFTRPFLSELHFSSPNAHSLGTATKAFDEGLSLL
jgi:hypothetical protein